MKHNDMNTTLQTLKEKARAFRDDRNWKQFHNPKDLAINIAVEASELLELFLWKKEKETEELFRNNAEFRQEVLDELADVLHACLALTNALEGVDLASAFIAKLEKTAQKYPIEKAKGRKDKYTKL